MVIEEVAAVRQWLQTLEVTPTIVAEGRVEDIKRAEVEKALARWGIFHHKSGRWWRPWPHRS